MEELKTRLKRLHEELAATDKIDPEMARLLQTLDGDIHTMLEKSAAGDDVDGGLATRAESIAAKFRARHPRVEALLREVSETLARLGI